MRFLTINAKKKNCFSGNYTILFIILQKCSRCRRLRQRWSIRRWWWCLWKRARWCPLIRRRWRWRYHWKHGIVSDSMVNVVEIMRPSQNLTDMKSRALTMMTKKRWTMNNAETLTDKWTRERRWKLKIEVEFQVHLWMRIWMESIQRMK